MPDLEADVGVGRLYFPRCEDRTGRKAGRKNGAANQVRVCFHDGWQVIKWNEFATEGEAGCTQVNPRQCKPGSKVTTKEITVCMAQILNTRSVLDKP